LTFGGLEYDRAAELAALVSACEQPRERSAGSGEPLALLVRLAELRDRAVVTDAEYREKKRDLLERMLAD
jgi:hypothetical protein